MSWLMVVGQDTLRDRGALLGYLGHQVDVAGLADLGGDHVHHLGRRNPVVHERLEPLTHRSW